jgi:hypothetical protein
MAAATRPTAVIIAMTVPAAGTDTVAAAPTAVLIAIGLVIVAGVTAVIADVALNTHSGDGARVQTGQRQCENSPCE